MSAIDFENCFYLLFDTENLTNNFRICYGFKIYSVSFTLK